MKKTFIVSRYNTHEFIHTEDTYCKLQLILKYYRKGYRVWDYPIWMAKFFKVYFGISLNWGNRNVYFEKYILGTDQVTWYTPW